MNPFIPILVADLLDDLGTDLSGGLIGIFTSQLGPVAWAVAILVVLLPQQNRVGVIPLAIMGLFLWGTVQIIIPNEAFRIGYGVMALGLAVLLTALFLGWRPRYV